MDLVFDAHLHIIDPAYPLWENNGYLPDAFPVSQYLQRVRSLNICSGAVVSGSFQRFDQSYLVAALQLLGPDFVGVTQLPASASDEEILELDGKGVRALRFNLKRGGSEAVSALDYFARRVYDLAGWHIELYADSDALAQLEPMLSGLPAVSVDHLGLDRKGLARLESLAGKGIRIKATGFGRLDFEPFDAIERLHAINPEAVLFGTDLPSTRAPEAFEDAHFSRLVEVLGEVAAEKICWSNARSFYRFSSSCTQ